MSANIWCWLPVLGLLPSSQDFNHRVEMIQESRRAEPVPAIVEFAGALVKHYPELSRNDPDTAWAVGPLLRDASGPFIDIGIQWDKYDDAAQLVFTTARQFGLNCYDPQKSRYYPARP
jgi:hypothetical protein